MASTVLTHVAQDDVNRIGDRQKIDAAKSLLAKMESSPTEYMDEPTLGVCVYDGFFHNDGIAYSCYVEFDYNKTEETLTVHKIAVGSVGPH
jgi:hypothetical protein